MLRILRHSSPLIVLVALTCLIAACGATPSAGCTSVGCTSTTPKPAQFISLNTSSPAGGPQSPSILREVDAPDWLSHGGNSSAYPNETFLTGIAAARGDDALAKAMAEAAADLANRIEVHIEHELTDYNSEKNGKVDFRIAAMTKLTSNVKLKGLKYEIAHVGTDLYALAYLRRSEAAGDRRIELQSTLSSLRDCMKSARLQRSEGGTGAASRYQSCLIHVTQGLQHEAVIRTIDPQGVPSNVRNELLQSLQEVREATDVLTSKSATSLKEAADFLAIQLLSQHNHEYEFKDAPSFRFGVTNFSSAFGQQLSVYLENAVARANGDIRKPGSGITAVAIQGTYFEEASNVRITSTLIEVPTGKVLAGAEALIAKAALPDGLWIVPKNLESALADQRLLSKGELVDGNLHLEVWADKGRRGVVYTESEEIRLFIRVNAPAYVRLVYVLESGIQVPIDQAYYMDSTKVNMAVEYPNRFEVAPPFGIEHIHATAFTVKPPPLPESTRVLDGVTYTIIEDGLASLVRHRGIKRKVEDEVAESLLTITTLPRPRDVRH